MADAGGSRNTGVGGAEGFVVLPCSGLDKEAGAVSRELALLLGDSGATVVCPVLFERVPKRYEKELGRGKLIVIDGCKTGCASKLARERGLKIARRVTVTKVLKERNIKLGKKPRVSSGATLVIPGVAEELIKPEEVRAFREEGFASAVPMKEFTVDKYVFTVPESGYFFNENDCWARVEGERARLGVSDYVQQSASDMVFFEPPAIGAEISIFDEAGALESTKTALDIISPVTGKVVAVNAELAEAPELINEDPYVKGWAVEVELSDFEGDRDLLMDCDHYFEYLKQKVEREFKDKYG